MQWALAVPWELLLEQRRQGTEQQRGKGRAKDAQLDTRGQAGWGWRDKGSCSDIRGTKQPTCSPDCKSQQVRRRRWQQLAPGSIWNSTAGATLKTHISKEIFWKKFFSSESVMNYVPKAIPWWFQALKTVVVGTCHPCVKKKESASSPEHIQGFKKADISG